MWCGQQWECVWWWWPAVRQGENAADFDPYPRALSRHRWSEAHPSTSRLAAAAAHNPLNSTSGAAAQNTTADNRAFCKLSVHYLHKMPAYLPLKHPLNSKQQMANISTHANTAHLSFFSPWMSLIEKAGGFDVCTSWLVNCKLQAHIFLACILAWRPALPPSLYSNLTLLMKCPPIVSSCSHLLLLALCALCSSCFRHIISIFW